jgi:RNA polymerase sigma factor (TIGR02999 family)
MSDKPAEVAPQAPLEPREISDGREAVSAILLPAVYAELRSLAAARMARESPDHTLQPTALVHEAWMRLAGSAAELPNASRGQFLAAASEAMRRILIEHARRRNAQKRGGLRRRMPVELDELPLDGPADSLLSLGESLEMLVQEDRPAAEVAQMRVLGGMTFDEIAEALGTSRTAVHRQWTFARAWLKSRLADGPG